MNRIYCWATNFSPPGGESELATKFVQIASNAKRNNRFIVMSPNKFSIFQSGKLVREFGKAEKMQAAGNLNLFDKYLMPLIGAFKLRALSKKSKATIYLNYLPLWNFILFAIIPKETILGPIVGPKIKFRISFFYKFLLNAIFYRLSIFVLKDKFKYIILANPTLTQYFSSNNFDIICKDLGLLTTVNRCRKRISEDKQFDIIFYFRKHANNNTLFTYKLINKVANNMKICVVGDYFNSDSINIHNFGYVTKNKFLDLIQNSRVALSLVDNTYSLTVYDYMASGIPVVAYYNGITSNLIKEYPIILIESLNLKQFEDSLHYNFDVVKPDYISNLTNQEFNSLNLFLLEVLN